MRRLIRIAAALACVLSLGAHADDRAEREPGARDDADFLGYPLVLPVADARLEAMRAGVPAPMTLQLAGVVLWDELRKPLPPQRPHSAAPAEAPRPITLKDN